MADSVSYEEVGESPFKPDSTELDTIHLQPSKYSVGAWSGVSSEEAKLQFENLYNTGFFIPTNFGIKLTPYKEDGLLSDGDVSLYDSYTLGLLLLPDFITEQPTEKTMAIPLLDPEFSALPFLCSSIPDIPLIEAVTESVNVGAFQMNYVTGHETGEITVNMIETRNGAIANSIKAIKDCMFNSDGTQNLPSEYAMILEIYAYDRHSRSLNIMKFRYLVALKTSSVSLDVENKSAGCIIPITFTKLAPNILANG